MSRELKLALVVGFCVVMVVAVLVSDHLSKANKAQLATGSDAVPTVIAAKLPDQPLPGLEDYLPRNGIPGAAQTDPVESVPPVPAPESAIDTRRLDISRPDAPAQDAAPIGIAPKGGTTPGSGQGNTVVPGTSQPTTIPAPKPPIGSGTGKTLGMQPPPIDTGVTKQLDPTSKPEPKKPELAQGPVRSGPVAGEKSHTIAEGDTLFKVCKKYYGDGTLWKQLATYNSGKLGKDGTLKTGAVLSIPPREVLTGKAAPAVAPKLEAKPADPKATKPKTELAAADKAQTDKLAADKAKKSKVATYTVKPGDTIGTISRKLLGTSKRAQEIIDLNASSASFSEDELTPGMVIKVPSA